MSMYVFMIYVCISKIQMIKIIEKEKLNNCLFSYLFMFNELFISSYSSHSICVFGVN